jgi:hypothetical protein
MRAGLGRVLTVLATVGLQAAAVAAAEELRLFGILVPIIISTHPL